MRRLSPPPRRSQDTRSVSPNPTSTLRRSSSDVSHPRKRLLAKLKNAGATNTSNNTNSTGNVQIPTSKQSVSSHSRTGSSTALSPPPSAAGTGAIVASKTSNNSTKCVRDMHRLGNIPAQVALAPAMTAAASASSLSLVSTATLTTNVPSSGSSTTDPWHMLHVHVLPLFNGEPLRMPIESLNQLVQKHVSTVVSRSLSRAISTLEQDLVALLSAGMITINVKLSELSDEKLLPRVVEIWEFFWHQVLPYVEGVFHPLHTDKVIKTLSRTPKTQRSSSPTLPDDTLPTASPQNIDVRVLALRSFRDSIVLPIFPRLHALLTSPRKDKDGSSQEKSYNHPRLQQMLLVLISTAHHPHSLSEPPLLTQGEGAVAQLLRDIRNPQVAASPLLLGGTRTSFFSGSVPRDRRGRIARRSARYTALNLKPGSRFQVDEDLPNEVTPRNAGFGDERDGERADLESSRNSETDTEEPDYAEGGAGGWGLGRGREHEGEEEEDDDEPPDWDQAAQTVVERMIGLRG